MWDISQYALNNAPNTPFAGILHMCSGDHELMALIKFAPPSPIRRPCVELVPVWGCGSSKRLSCQITYVCSENVKLIRGFVLILLKMSAQLALAGIELPD